MVVFKDVDRKYGIYNQNTENEEEEKALNVLSLSDIDPNKIQVLYRITDIEGERFFQKGIPLLGACSHLSIQNKKAAIVKLVRANEPFLGYMVSYLLEYMTDSILIVLSRRAESIGMK